MAEYNPISTSGVQPFTRTTGGTVTGGKLVMPAGTSPVTHASAAGAAKAIGVAAHDAASGSRLTVWPLANVIHLVLCPAGATAGDGVVAGDAGIAVKATGGGFAAAAAAGTLLGIVLEDVAADAAAHVKFIGRG